MHEQLYRLPEGMRALAQWCVAGASKAPMYATPDGQLHLASVTSPSQWMSFERALQVMQQNANRVTRHTTKSGEVVQTGLHIGFVLHEDDPFTCIDLDVKNATNAPNEPERWTTPEDMDLMNRIVAAFDCYSELSRSGLGMHIWALGAIGPGFRRGSVEVYSQERFIICTGNVFNDKPPADRSLHLANMVQQMRPVPKNFALVEYEAEGDDWYVLERAYNASNSDKFLTLWQGDYSEFPSQSEADLALMSMLAFYSRSNEQCRRLFRESALGKREKARKNDVYLNRTLNIIRQRQERESRVDLSGIQQAAQAFQRAQVQAPPAPQPAAVAPAQPAQPVQQPQAHPAPAPLLTPVTAAAPEPPAPQADGLLWPPGFAGHIARFIYASAPRPVQEVAIVATLGLLAGITGKAWHIPKSGLNLYIILIARSAIGKETLHQGISEIISACSKDNPTFSKYFDFTEYVSGPALIKACVANPSFVNVLGEWGRKLKRLSVDDARDSGLQTLRTQMTNLYQKSGPQAIVGGIGYSSTDNNVASIAGVSYSMIGETTPGTFYESLTESMMEDGFLSRFLTVEYNGPRPAPNLDSNVQPDDRMKHALNALCATADMHISKGHSKLVLRSEEAEQLAREFERLCDANINATQDESRRQMWNRAALKAFRIAAVLAVADHWIEPCVSADHMRWAIEAVMRDIGIMRKRILGGDVGSGDSSRDRKMAQIMSEYLSKPVSPGYKVPDTMRQNSIVPKSYLKLRANSAAAFYSSRNGLNRALDDTLASMLSAGYIMEVAKDKVVDAYNYHGKAYRILHLPDFEND